MSFSSDMDWIQSVHDLLPPSVHAALSFVLLEHVEHADYIYGAIVTVLTVLVILQSHAFARPPPVPLKRLPKRPTIQFYFKPDDVTSTIIADKKAAQQQPSQSMDNKSTSTWTRVRRSLSSTIFKVNKHEDATMSSDKEDHNEGHVESDADSFLDDKLGLDLGDEEEEESVEQTNPFSFSTDLPDSFAPLLSSSQVEVETGELPADVIHAVQVKAELRLRPGRHEIPLDMDQSRPQFILDVPTGGCRISAVAAVGSDGFSSTQDLDASVPTTQRSKPMVKHAGLVLDPPLPLSNVAPTLIHFPTLFEDNFVPTLRRIQIVRYFIDFIISISSFLEKCLWIVETKCKIHLSKVRITPIYKGTKDSSPDWRLSLAFSGHCLLFGFIPVPFISVALPTFIIPQPHALLDKLLTKQPLASAKLRREYIDEEKIGLAAVEAAEQWRTDVKLVATPPAVGLDVTLPGGVTMALKLGLGRDSNSETAATEDEDPPPMAQAPSPAFQPTSGSSVDGSISSYSTREEPMGSRNRRHKFRGPRELKSSQSALSNVGPYDANVAVPWSFQFKAKGKIDHDKMTFRLLKLMARQQRSPTSAPLCKFESSGSFAIWKDGPDSASQQNHPAMSSTPLRRKANRSTLVTNRFPLDSEESPSVSAVLLFPEETSSYRHDQRMLTYDYAFDVSDDSCVDAITLSVGATHPMLKGATSVTTILEKLYCYGSMGAREDAILDPMERKRKRNVLRHLPAIDLTFGVQNVFIPPESHSYSDDGQTLFLPELEGGRLMARVLGGIQDTGRSDMPSDAVYEGVKLIVDFEVATLNLNTQGKVKEFPELDIFEGDQLKTTLSGIIGGSIRSHLRPQALDSLMETTGKNIYNPLEAYEIEFSGSNLNVKMKEFTAALAHRRIIFPTETAFVVSVIESIVDMGFEGRTQCDLSWDFNGLSPILQVTAPDQTPESVGPENKQQVSLLISPLRFGLISFHVSSVGGIKIKKAATAREDREGLFDWKFFNAIVSPDETSMERIFDVVHDKRTMEKLLQVVELVNNDLHKILKYVLKQVWRAKEILDAEGVTDPANVIPMYKMSRLVTLFITGDVEEIDRILPIVGKVVHGEGLDVVKVKEMLREHLEFYDDWAPELDRALRWAELMFSPQSVSPNFVEENVVPLEEIPRHVAKLQGIPSATEIYEKITDKPQLPLDPGFSKLVSRVAPYLTFVQIEYLLHARTASDWQQSDLRRLRYVFSIKRKVLEIAESYGGLSFLPQSFLVSVFLGEATRNSHRAPQKRSASKLQSKWSIPTRGTNMLKTERLAGRELGSGSSRFRSGGSPQMGSSGMSNITPPGSAKESVPSRVFVSQNSGPDEVEEYELGDSLLGPQDVAILLQSGLTSVMKSSTVVQLNQRMLLDLICSQPRTFAIAVLAEIGMPSGQGEPRSLTSALMALLELDQTAFKPEHQVDMHALLESWLPGVRMPRREDYMAGGRWARQSYYDSIFAVSKSILDDAETYNAVKWHIQRSRRVSESDPIPRPKEETKESNDMNDSRATSRLLESTAKAKRLIEEADALGASVADDVVSKGNTKESPDYGMAVQKYQEAFTACAAVVEMDKHAFHADWFASFFKRNYDALMIRNMYDNVVNDVDLVRHWLHALRNGALAKETSSPKIPSPATLTQTTESGDWEPVDDAPIEHDAFFLEPEKRSEQEIVDAIIHATIYHESDRDRLLKEPLVRLLIPNPPGKYNFTIISAMGVITEGKKGLELKDAFARLERERGVQVIRADTGTARSLEYNATKIEDAIYEASKLQRPFGLLGYSQGCANILKIETLMVSGTPRQREIITCPKAGLVCRQLLFSAANGSAHGPAMGRKIQKLIVMCEEFFKYQQGYASRALAKSVLEILNGALDSSDFHKFMGGAQVFLPDGCRAFWRESQHLAHVTTCTLRGVMEDHTTPESLLMVSKMLTKQSGSHLHDSQVHAYDAVGYPVYHRNRNSKILKRCCVGEGTVQRTHHWSPLSDEVEFVQTPKDIKMGSFQCAKDRHVFPWVEVNARFGFIKPVSSTQTTPKERHPSAMINERSVERKEDSP